MLFSARFLGVSVLVFSVSFNISSASIDPQSYLEKVEEDNANMMALVTKNVLPKNYHLFVLSDVAKQGFIKDLIDDGNKELHVRFQDEEETVDDVEAYNNNDEKVAGDIIKEQIHPAHLTQFILQIDTQGLCNTLDLLHGLVTTKHRFVFGFADEVVKILIKKLKNVDEDVQIRALDLLIALVAQWHEVAFDFAIKSVAILKTSTNERVQKRCLWLVESLITVPVRSHNVFEMPKGVLNLTNKLLENILKNSTDGQVLEIALGVADSLIESDDLSASKIKKKIVEKIRLGVANEQPSIFARLRAYWNW